MKKIFFLSLLFVVFNARAQDGIVFKMKYLPGHNYCTVSNTSVTCNISLSGDQKIIDQLSSQGFTQPLAVNMESTGIGSIKSGDADKNNTFPMVFDFNRARFVFTVNGKDVPLPAKNTNIKVYLHSNIDGKYTPDSLVGGNLKDTSAQMILKLLGTIRNEIKFPDHPLLVGDSFTQDVPINIPTAGSNISLAIKIVYKLAKIADGKAFFDVDQKMDMQIPVKQSSVTLTGTGSGNLVYNTKENVPTDFKSTLNIKFNGSIEAVNISGSAILNTDYKITIN